MIDAAIVEVPNARQPYGVRGAGEAALAIYHAVGIRLPELPMSPESVLKALVAKSVQEQDPVAMIY